jgi:uncharacterized phiE125 gp8 family phage protein
MPVKLVTPSEDLVVTLAEAKAHLRVNSTDENDLIEALIKAATDYTEQFLGRSLLDQTWDFYLDAFPLAGKPILVPLPPLIEVTGVFYNDLNDDEQEFDSGDYAVDTASEPARIYLPSNGSWPSATSAMNAVRVRYRAGFLDNNSPQAANVPFAIKAAILMTVGTLYEHRETLVIGQTAVLLPWAAEQLLRPYRVHVAMA